MCATSKGERCCSAESFGGMMMILCGRDSTVTDSQEGRGRVTHDLRAPKGIQIGPTKEQASKQLNDSIFLKPGKFLKSEGISKNFEILSRKELTIISLLVEQESGFHSINTT